MQTCAGLADRQIEALAACDPLESRIAQKACHFSGRCQHHPARRVARYMRLMDVDCYQPCSGLCSTAPVLATAAPCTSDVKQPVAPLPSTSDQHMAFLQSYRASITPKFQQLLTLLAGQEVARNLAVAQASRGAAACCCCCCCPSDLPGTLAHAQRCLQALPCCHCGTGARLSSASAAPSVLRRGGGARVSSGRCRLIASPATQGACFPGPLPCRRYGRTFRC